MVPSMKPLISSECINRSSKIKWTAEKIRVATCLSSNTNSFTNAENKFGELFMKKEN